MPLFNEKRKPSDRRVRNDGPPPGCRERRSKRDRRQTVISEISFHEWTRYFLRFKNRAAVKTMARAKEPAAGPPRAGSGVRGAGRKDDNDPDAHAAPVTSLFPANGRGRARQAATKPGVR
jgi:hypothetical protein